MNNNILLTTILDFDFLLFIYYFTSVPFKRDTSENYSILLMTSEKFLMRAN